MVGEKKWERGVEIPAEITTGVRNALRTWESFPRVHAAVKLSRWLHLAVYSAGKSTLFTSAFWTLPARTNFVANRSILVTIFRGQRPPGTRGGTIKKQRSLFIPLAITRLFNGLRLSQARRTFGGIFPTSFCFCFSFTAMRYYSSRFPPPTQVSQGTTSGVYFFYY